MLGRSLPDHSGIRTKQGGEEDKERKKEELRFFYKKISGEPPSPRDPQSGWTLRKTKPGNPSIFINSRQKTPSGFIARASGDPSFIPLSPVSSRPHSVALSPRPRGPEKIPRQPTRPRITALLRTICSRFRFLQLTLAFGVSGPSSVWLPSGSGSAKSTSPIVPARAG